LAPFRGTRRYDVGAASDRGAQEHTMQHAECRTHGIAAIAGLVGTFLLLLATVGCAAPLTYTSLAQAVEAGALDSTVYKTYQAGKTQRVLLVFQSTPLKVTYDKYARPAYSEEQALNVFRESIAKDKAAFRERFPLLEPIRNYAEFPLQLVQIDKRSDLLAMLNSGLLAGISADAVNRFLSSANLSFIGATRVRGWNETGAGVGIAVIDSGIDFSRAEFGACAAAGAGCKVRFAQDFAIEDNTRDASLVLHGTNVASIAVQVAAGAHLLSMDVADAADTIKDSDAISALSWIAAHRTEYNVRVANLSFGRDDYSTTTCTPPRNPYLSAFSTLRALGVLPVVAAGNKATVGGVFRSGLSQPACTAGAVSVGAVHDAVGGPFVNPTCTDPTAVPDQPTCFSQSAPILTLLAPGDAITGGGMTLSGTSQATPHVSGAIALLSGFEPGATIATLQTTLTASGTPVLDSRNGVTTPRINLPAALTSRAPNPANDAFAQALLLTGTRASVRQVTWNAGEESGEPDHAGNFGGASLWYRWVAPYTGTAVIDTAGSNFDTLLAVYTGTSLTALTPIASNNDRAAGAKDSLVVFGVTSGTEYRIAVDGARIGVATSRGTAVLSINGQAANDAVARAVDVMVGGSVDGNNFGATKEAGEFQHCANQGGASVWYAVTPAVTGTFRARSTSSTFGNRCVAVYRSTAPRSGVTVGNLAYVAGGMWASPDDTWSATFAGQANETYYVVVEGMSSEEPGFDAPARGAFNLSVAQL
jgi:hypothetical protein